MNNYETLEQLQDGSVVTPSGDVLPGYTGANAPQFFEDDARDEINDFMCPAPSDQLFDGDIPPEMMPVDSPEYLRWRMEQIIEKGRARANQEMSASSSAIVDDLPSDDNRSLYDIRYPVASGDDGQIISSTRRHPSGRRSARSAEKYALRQNPWLT